MQCDVMRRLLNLMPDKMVGEDTFRAMTYMTSAQATWSGASTRAATTGFTVISGASAKPSVGVPVEKLYPRRWLLPVAWMLWWVCLLSVPACGPAPGQPDVLVREPDRTQLSDRTPSSGDASESPGFIPHRDRWTPQGPPSELVAPEAMNEERSTDETAAFEPDDWDVAQETDQVGEHIEEDDGADVQDE